MADRKFPIITGEFYHVFNRGVARQPTFLTKKHYQQAMLALSYYRFRNHPVKLSRFKEWSHEEQTKVLDKLKQVAETYVKIISFVFMPNHFHFLLQQTVDQGIAHFIAKFTNSYTKYLNTKHERVGPIFQGVYKAVHVESDEQLIHVSRYIHLNPVVSDVVKQSELSTYPWSSFPDFLNGKSTLVDLNTIMGSFPSIEGYKKFVFDQIDYARTLENIKHLVLED